jgi:hypothetical protein
VTIGTPTRPALHPVPQDHLGRVAGSFGLRGRRARPDDRIRTRASSPASFSFGDEVMTQPFQQGRSAGDRAVANTIASAHREGADRDRAAGAARRSQAWAGPESLGHAEATFCSGNAWSRTILDARGSVTRLTRSC